MRREVSKDPAPRLCSVYVEQAHHFSFSVHGRDTVKFTARLAQLCALCLLGAALFVTPAASAADPDSTGSVEIAKKKKKKKKCSAGSKLSGGKCKKGPYKKGQTCSMSKQKEYIKYGLICLDLSTPGFPLTTLDVYKK